MGLKGKPIIQRYNELFVPKYPKEFSSKINVTLISDICTSV